jgi:hypothetical protein
MIAGMLVRSIGGTSARNGQRQGGSGMSEGPGKDTATISDAPEAALDDVEEMRERLGETAEELAQRAGVKAKLAGTKAELGAQAEQLKAKAGEAMPQSAQEAAHRARAAAQGRPARFTVVGIVLAMLLLAVLVRSRRA